MVINSRQWGARQAGYLDFILTAGQPAPPAQKSKKSLIFGASFLTPGRLSKRRRPRQIRFSFLLRQSDTQCRIMRYPEATNNRFSTHPIVPIITQEIKLRGQVLNLNPRVVCGGAEQGCTMGQRCPPWVRSWRKFALFL